MANNNDWMKYRANRQPQQDPTPLESYGEAHIVSFLRKYMEMKDPRVPGKVVPNHNFGPIVEDAARMSEKIDFFDSHPDLMDQVVFGVACPELAHPGVKDVIETRPLVTLLLVRHFKKYGGLCLPPLEVGRKVHDANLAQVGADIAARRQPSLVHYPNWRQVELQKAAEAAEAKANKTKSGNV